MQKQFDFTFFPHENIYFFDSNLIVRRRNFNLKLLLERIEKVQIGLTKPQIYFW